MDLVLLYQLLMWKLMFVLNKNANRIEIYMDLPWNFWGWIRWWVVRRWMWSWVKEGVFPHRVGTGSKKWLNHGQLFGNPEGPTVETLDMRHMPAKRSVNRATFWKGLVLPIYDAKSYFVSSCCLSIALLLCSLLFWAVSILAWFGKIW